ncbi:hypothetical protein JH26_10360 [Microvirga sp. BSC39]|nr:hypothetical protein JH26_10360 [Microvirga sp. BSC39]
MVNDGLRGFMGRSDQQAVADQVGLHPLPGRLHSTRMKLSALNRGDFLEMYRARGQGGSERGP